MSSLSPSLYFWSPPISSFPPYHSFLVSLLSSSSISSVLFEELEKSSFKLFQFLSSFFWGWNFHHERARERERNLRPLQKFEGNIVRQHFFRSRFISLTFFAIDLKEGKDAFDKITFLEENFSSCDTCTINLSSSCSLSLYLPLLCCDLYFSTRREFSLSSSKVLYSTWMGSSSILLKWNPFSVRTCLNWWIEFQLQELKMLLVQREQLRSI